MCLQWSGRKLQWVLGLRAKVTPFIVKCFQCWWEALLWHHWRLNYFIDSSPLCRVHRRKSRVGHQGKLHHAALPGCRRHPEMPWEQTMSPAPYLQGTEHLERKAQWALLSLKSVREFGAPKLSSEKQNFPLSQGCHESQFNTSSSEAFSY